MGSGVIVTAGGRILTNAHVVNGADDIKVTVQDGTDYEAKIVGIDAKADLAVLQLKGKLPALKPLAFADSSQLRLGEVVLAVVLIVLLFLWHVPSVVIPLITIPVAVLVAFIPFGALGITANIMSLGGIAIAMG